MGITIYSNSFYLMKKENLLKETKWSKDRYLTTLMIFKIMIVTYTTFFKWNSYCCDRGLICEQYLS